MQENRAETTDCTDARGRAATEAVSDMQEAAAAGVKDIKEAKKEELPEEGRKVGVKKDHFLLWFLTKTLLLVCCIAFIVTCVLCLYRVDGNQMFPGLRDGDLAVFLRGQDCYMDDVVLYQDADGDIRAGRIVATGGQTVCFLEDGGYEVDGAVAYDEVPYETYGVTDSAYGAAGVMVTLVEDEYFILNDYRSDTLDSRELGPVKQQKIIGKLLVLLRVRSF